MNSVSGSAFGEIMDSRYDYAHSFNLQLILVIESDHSEKVQQLQHEKDELNDQLKKSVEKTRDLQRKFVGVSVFSFNMWVSNEIRMKLCMKKLLFRRPLRDWKTLSVIQRKLGNLM